MKDKSNENDISARSNDVSTDNGTQETKRYVPIEKWVDQILQAIATDNCDRQTIRGIVCHIKIETYKEAKLVHEARIPSEYP